ncbi:MAG: DNA repair protein RadA [Candidatus Sabulitectum sp.]|nr:DNA repair protein RadA [Candidatus Sabulitectum sp.]
MAGKKPRSVFFCTECGGESAVWAGKCPHCGSWNTMVEEVVERVSASAATGYSSKVEAVSIVDVDIENGERISTHIGEFDRVLGGGAFKGSVILIGGQPGIGKSTLMIQAAMNMAASGLKVLYATGEESPGQVADRAGRVGTPSANLMLLPTTDLAAVERKIEADSYQVLIVDSMQTLHTNQLSSAAGSVSQVRQCASSLVNLAKPRGLTVFVIGHVTKEGSIAGPKVLEHLVDAVISFEGDSFHQFRLLRAVKNRFGSTSELGVFEMKEKGLKEVADASGYFLQRDGGLGAGSAVAAIMEGTRPFLVEIQALTSTTHYGFPQRRATGFDSGRLAMLLAVLERRCGIELGNQDVYVNVAGGFNIVDPGADMAVCLAVASSRLERPLKKDTALSGEVGLGGEIRPVAGIDRRLAESGNLGFSNLACAREKKEDTGPNFRFSTLSAAISGLLVEKGEEWLN